MKDVWPDAASAFYFDYHARLVNTVISFLGLLSNIFHFSILIRKSLRSSPVFSMMFVICICDLLQLLTQTQNDIKYILEFNQPDFCLGFDTYYATALTLTMETLGGFSMLVSSCLVILVALFRSLSIKFAMSKWSSTLAKTSTARKTSLIVIIISAMYNLSATHFKYKITPKSDDAFCAFSFYTGASSERRLYSASDGHSSTNAILLFTLFDGLIQIFQLIVFIFTSLILSRFIKEASSMKMMKSKSDRQAEKTEGLILFTLCSFFISTFPIIIANFMLPLFANLQIIP